MAEDRKDREGAFEKVGEAMGGLAGKAAGRGMDMATNVAGSIMSTAAGVLGGWWATADANRAAASFDQRSDEACRTHFRETSSATGARARTYDQSRPAYEFGHLAGQNPDYQGRSFDQVERDLESAWERAGRERYGDWPDVRGYVGFGFEQPGGGSTA